jgi:hypothetical protein
MKVTNDQVISAYYLLSKLNLRKFDKEIRVSIYKNTIELQIATKSIREKISETRKEVFKDLGNDIIAVNSLREDLCKPEITESRKKEIIKEIESYDNVISAEKDFEEVLNKFGKDYLELNLIKVNLDKFLDGLSENNIDFNFHQLQAIEFLFH